MKSMDGRRSVTPVQGNDEFNTFMSKKLDNLQRDFIQEMEDEDHSSIASRSRISQIMQMSDDISNRPSVFSVKN